MGYIYCITNEINGKQYVGKTVYSVNKRWQEHCLDYLKDRNEKRPLYDAMNKYGINNFSIETLQEYDELDLTSWEIFWIDKLDTYKNGYNATLGGDGKILFDYKQIIELYKQGKTMKEVSIEVGCCIDTVSKVVNSYNIPKNKVFVGSCKQPKRIKMFNENNFQIFESCASAAHWLVDNKYAKTYNGGVRGKISMCANGQLKTAYKHKWEWV